MTLLQTLYQNLPHPDQSEADWSNLPPDLVHLISRNLNDVFDFVHFRAVCKTWRSAVQASELPPQLPWIVHHTCRLYSVHSPGYLRCYSLLTGKTYVIKVLGSSDKYVKGSAYNYLLADNWTTRDCSLINPLTNEELSFPQIRYFPNCVPSSMYPGQSLRYVGISGISTQYHTNLLFCELGDLKWTKIFNDSRNDDFLNEGFAIYDGIYYVTDIETKSTQVIDLATRTIIYTVPKPEDDLRDICVYLVVSFGEVLRICQYNKFSEQEPCYFVIYRLELGNTDENVKKPSWFKIDNVGDRILFLHVKHGCAFRANDFSGFVANGIYFTKPLLSETAQTFEISRYDIKERKIEVLDVPPKLGTNWFVPSLC